jgi:hypothetical protein
MRYVYIVSFAKHSDAVSYWANRRDAIAEAKKFSASGIGQCFRLKVTKQPLGRGVIDGRVIWPAPEAEKKSL